jgi:aminoglycoside phosphotransferase (APT) family kinase protein
MIEALFEQHLGARVQATADLSIGLEQKVHRVSTDRGVFICKQPLHDRGINTREKLATDLALAHGVPAPRVLWYDEQTLIEEHIEGVPLDRAQLSPGQRQRFWGEWGELLARLHSCGLEGFGRLAADGRGQCASYLEFYRSQSEHRQGGWPNARARAYYQEHRHYLERPRAVLVHFDMEEEHVLVRDGRIVGFVDFASAFAGSPAEELTRLYGLRWKDPLMQSLLEAYPAIDREEVEFFTFLHLHWRIPWHAAKGNRPEKVLLLTELYRRITGAPRRQRRSDLV